VGVQKSEIKMAVAHELGNGFDDALEAANRDCYRWDGAKTSLKKAVTAIEGLVEHAKRDLDAETLTDEQYVLVRKWLQRSAEVIRNLNAQAEIKEQRAHGRVEAFKTVVKITKKVYDDESNKRDALLEQPDSDETRPVPERPVGMCPQNTIAERREAEEDGD
jgi:hypothetical protein